VVAEENECRPMVSLCNCNTWVQIVGEGLFEDVARGAWELKAITAKGWESDKD